MTPAEISLGFITLLTILAVIAMVKIITNLYKRGIIEKGSYVINIDW